MSVVYEVAASTGVAWTAVATGAAAVLAGSLAIATIVFRWRADSAALQQRWAADSSALKQRRTSDDRAEWWRRTQWAIDRTISDRPLESVAGLLMLAELIESPLASARDQLLLGDIAANILESTPEES